MAGVANAYTIKRGDTLWGLFGTSWRTIAQYNNITDPTKLQIGQTIKIPGESGKDVVKLGGAPTVNIKYVQSQYYTLAGAGCSLGATTVVLSSFKQIDGTLLTMSNFGIKGFGTIEPNNGTKEEQIVFTGVTQNANGTATLTGVSRVLTVYPYTETSGVASSHTGGVKFVVSNTAGFYNTFTNKYNDETVTGTWTFNADPQSSNATQAYIGDTIYATQYYVDNVGAGGFTAANVSTTLGLKATGAVPEKVGINASSTTGGSFDTTGKYYQAIGNGLEYGSSTIRINTGQNFSWTGAHTFTGNTIMATTTLTSTTITQLTVNNTSTFSVYPTFPATVPTTSQPITYTMWDTLGIVSSSVLQVSADTERSCVDTQACDTAPIKRFRVAYKGKLGYSFSYKGNSPAGQDNGYFTLARNGYSVFSVDPITSNGYAATSTEISVMPGDEITLTPTVKGGYSLYTKENRLYYTIATSTVTTEAILD